MIIQKAYNVFSIILIIILGGIIMNNLIVRDDVWTEKAKNLFRIRKIRLQYEKAEKELMREFKAINGNQESFGNGYKFTKVIKPGVIKYSDIPELKNIDIDKYRGNKLVSWKLDYVGE